LNAQTPLKNEQALTDSVIPELVRQNLARRSAREKMTTEILDLYRHGLGEVVGWLADNTSPLRPSDMGGLLKELDDADLERVVALLRHDDPIVAQRAQEALGYIGEKSVPYLIEVMDSRHPTGALRAKEAVERMGKDALPALREVCKSDDAGGSAILLLAKLDPDAVKNLEGFISDALRSSDQLKSRFAIDAVLSVGDRLIGLLIEMIGTSDPFAQQNATNALIELGELAVPELVDELDHPNPIVQQNTMRALREIGEPSIEHLNAAMEEDSSVLLQQNALAVLKAIGRPGRGKGAARAKGRGWFRR